MDHPTRQVVNNLSQYGDIDQLNRMLEFLKLDNLRLDRIEENNEIPIPKEGEDNEGGDNYFSRGTFSFFWYFVIFLYLRKSVP